MFAKLIEPGTRFGRLVVISSFVEEYADIRREQRSLCQCDCGSAPKKIRSSSLINNYTQSCGCLNLDNRRKAPGESGFNLLLKSYQDNAKKRGLIFELTRELFRTLTSSVCNYCGCDPCLITRIPAPSYSTEGYAHSKYVYNGIDRVDNLIGYTVSNSVPCCWRCNEWKRTMPLGDFVCQVKRIANYLSQ